MTHPAPRYLKDDLWFGPAVISDVNRDYMEKETQLKIETVSVESGESDNIHQIMYNIATQSQKNTIVWYDTGNVGGSDGRLEVQ